MSESLQPDGTPVSIGNVVVTSPGLSGTVEVYEARAQGLRAADSATPVFVQSLAETGVLEQLTIEITNPAEEYLLDDSQTRRTAGGQPGLTVQVPGPGSGMGQVMLHCDEDGALRWVYPDDMTPAARATRGGDTRTYTVARHVVPDPSPGTRGLLGAIGKKVLKVLAFKLLNTAGDLAAQYFAKQWEDKAHPHRLRTFAPDSYSNPLPGVATMTPEQLRQLAIGPALLFVHGTMSLSHSGFGRMPQALMTKLYDAYGGRVFAFDHPTVSVAPDANAKWLASQLGGAKLTLDIVSHSRGGLVSRELAERAAGAGLAADALTIRKLIMVGTPNGGTALADAKRLGDLVDRFTNLLSFVPDNAFTDVASIVLTVVKQLAVGAFGGLDGIAAMAPGSAYLNQLNGSGAAETNTYVAVASNYEPPANAPLARIARDKTTDFVFGNVTNDLIVPEQGVFAANGNARFPIANPLDFGARDSVDHSSYWTAPRADELFTQQLTG